MKKNPKNPNSAPQKGEEPITKKNDELGEGKLNKVIGGQKAVRDLEATFYTEYASDVKITGK
jgi:hypothetical protein